MYTVTINCAATGLISCGTPGWSTDDLSAPPPEQLTTALAESGWSRTDGKWYCPRHNQANLGTPVQISLDYIEIAPGVRVRYPGAERPYDGIWIEVQTDPADDNRGAA